MDKVNPLVQVNERELKYWEKLDSFSWLMFGCCIGFVSLVAPTALNGRVLQNARLWLSHSLINALFCALCMIPVVLCSVRQYRTLIEEGKRMMHAMKYYGEVNPPIQTRFEKICLRLSFVAAVSAALCLAVAMYKSL